MMELQPNTLETACVDVKSALMMDEEKTSEM